MSESREARNLWLELRLLCRAGVGIFSIAPRLCELIRKLVAADCAAACWLDDSGRPVGFHNDFSPPDLSDLFSNNYDLFDRPGEYGLGWILRQRGSTIGHSLATDRELGHSNIYNLLMRPLGHRHVLDLKVEVAGRTRALITLYRESRWPFDMADVSVLRLIEPWLQRAEQPSLGSPDRTTLVKEESLIASVCGRRLIGMTGGAEAMLREAQLVGQEISLVNDLEAPPRFVGELCGRYHQSGTNRTKLPAGGGWIDVVLRPIIEVGAAARFQALMFDLNYCRLESVALVSSVMDFKLSPLRSELLLFAMNGGRRVDAARQFQISKESLKKHLAEIFSATGVREWNELPRVLN